MLAASSPLGRAKRCRGLFAGLLLAFRVGLLIASAAPAVAQTCPASGDCCVDNGSPGCEDASCCSQICGLDPFCCLGAWDATCASAAVTLCAVCSGASCPGPGDCCVDNGTPACSDSDCCQQVCAQDGACCSNAWDQECADLALQLCGGSVCSGATCEGIGDCCDANGSPSCEAESCCSAVCAQDAFCCDVSWDTQCAVLAETLCAELCEPQPPVTAMTLWAQATVALMLLGSGALIYWRRAAT